MLLLFGDLTGLRATLITFAGAAVYQSADVALAMQHFTNARSRPRAGAFTRRGHPPAAKVLQIQRRVFAARVEVEGLGDRLGAPAVGAHAEDRGHHRCLLRVDAVVGVGTGRAAVGCDARHANIVVAIDPPAGHPALLGAYRQRIAGAQRGFLPLEFGEHILQHQLSALHGVQLALHLAGQVIVDLYPRRQDLFDDDGSASRIAADPTVLADNQCLEVG
ncbi:hypothetical protein OL229_16110 [Neisseriaceae bacterium JH1-16]|nr:hypothetical protein [Neisseriaceae bacterium JH1-16]